MSFLLEAACGETVALKFIVVVPDRVSLCGPGCPGTHPVDQASLELKRAACLPPPVLGLKACTTMTPVLKAFLYSNRCHQKLEQFISKFLENVPSQPCCFRLEAVLKINLYLSDCQCFF